MKYKVIIPPVKQKAKKGGLELVFPLEGLNELLAGRVKNYRTGKYHNPVKANNDHICCLAINKQLKNVRIKNPIRVHYHIVAANKRHDRMNLASAVEKSFADALQTCKVIEQDSWEYMINASYSFEVDKNNPHVEVVIEELINGN